MAIPVVCPHCEHDFNIPDEFAGVKGKCPQCNEPFTAPGEPPADSTDSKAPPPPAGESSQPPVVNESPEPATENEPAAPPIPRPPGRHTPVSFGVPTPILAAVMLVLFLLFAGGAAGAWWYSQTYRPVAESADQGEGLTDVQPPVDPPEKRPERPGRKMIDDKSRARIVAVYNKSIVRVIATIGDDRGRLVQQGWLADRAQRLVATSYLPADRVARVRVEFHNGEVESVQALGVVAQSSVHDYSILQLPAEALPPATAFATAPDWKADTPLIVAAFGRGRWQPVWSLGPLKAASKTSEPVLFAHTGRMAALPSGAPLFNSGGEVVGFNTLVDPAPNGQARAMSATVIHEALASLSAEPVVTKFGGAIEAVSVTPPIPEDPIDPTPEIDAPAAEVEMKVEDFIAAVDETRTAVEAFNWLPKTQEQQASLNKLARLVTVGKRIEDDQAKSDTDRIAAGSAAQQVLVDLSREPWPDDKNLALLNYLSMGDREEDDRGFHGFGVCLQWMDDEIEGRPVSLMQLLGTDLFIAVPVAIEKDDLPRGGTWRVIGEIRPDKTVPIIVPDGAGGSKNIDVLVIESKYLIGRPE